MGLDRVNQTVSELVIIQVTDFQNLILYSEGSQDVDQRP